MAAQAMNDALLVDRRLFKNFILEGPDVEQKNFRGLPIMPGWRHYKMIFGGRSANCISRQLTPEMAASKFQAKLFQRGTWEDTSRPVPKDFFPFPTAEVSQEVYQ